MRLAIILVSLLALQGCGQKGPLFIPAVQAQDPGPQQPDPQSTGVPSSQPGK
jgi:predicted small lipoprotein YifL